jgi:hypothetical protein
LLVNDMAVQTEPLLPKPVLGSVVAHLESGQREAVASDDELLVAAAAKEVSAGAVGHERSAYRHGRSSSSGSGVDW